MAATRLALSMDTSVVERARRISRTRKTSISRLFVSFICSLEEEERAAELPPLTRRALGLAKGKDAPPPDWDYREELSDILVERHA